VRGLEDLDRADQIVILRRTFADVGGAAPRILSELDDAPLYFDAIGQVRAAHWSQGRIALLGDAAFCASPVGGGSASLALIGAYVLAGELSRTDDHRSAFARYEEFMRPHVDNAQKVSPRILRGANPRTAAGIRALHASARLIASRAGRAATGLTGSLMTLAVDEVTLPDYGHTPSPADW
jgi:2-polyprenyl-6-methoxyphenol hydroxylase-like FAD-dependent oxidoreductase